MESIILSFLLGILVVVVFIIILEVVGRWNLFKKAGRNGWEAIIPFYSSWVYVEIAELNWWYFLLVIASSFATILEGFESIGYLVSIVGIFFCNYNISKKLHRDAFFAVLMTLFPFIMLPMIGFSKNYQWDDNVVVSCNGPINNTSSPNEDSFGGQTNTNYSGDINNNSFDNHDNFYDKNDSSDGIRFIKYCSGCGAELKKGSKFCANCGREI